MQHYVTHYPERLALRRNLGYPLGRLARAETRLAGLRKAAAAIGRIRRLCRNDRRFSVRRLPLLDEANPEEDLKNLRRLLRNIERGGFPYAAFQAFRRSQERYAEIRRLVRPGRQVPEEHLRLIRRLLGQSLRQARSAEERLAGASRSARPLASRYRRHVAAWRSFIEAELVGMELPEMTVRLPGKRGAQEAADVAGFVRLQHDQCFRYGEHAILDFLGFFGERAWRPQYDLFFRLAAEAGGLLVSLKEENVDMPARRERWRQYAGGNSDSFFLRVYIDREGLGRRFRCWHIMCKARRVLYGELELLGRQHTRSTLLREFTAGKARWREHAGGYRLDYLLLWRALGSEPKAGEAWRFNVTANPFIARHHQTSWATGYEYRLGKGSRMGYVRFVGR